MAADHFCLRWNNYQSNMVSELDSLRSDEDLVDVTLSCGGHQLKAHKVILSACSSYFRNVFKENPCKHPVVILKDVCYDDVEALLSFVYQGVVYISEKKLASFLQTAELLQIRGLTGAASTMKDDVLMNQNKSNAEKSNVPPPPQLLTAKLVNSWKQQQQQQQGSLAVSPSPPPKPKQSTVNEASNISFKRRKTHPSKLVSQENSDDSDQEFTDTENEMPTIKSEIEENEEKDNEDFVSGDESLREDPNREGNSYLENIEVDETEEEDDIDLSKDPGLLNVADAPGSPTLFKTPDLSVNISGTSTTNVFNVITGFPITGTSTDQPNCGPGSHLAQCGNCPHCGQKYSNQSALKYHVRLMHSDLTNRLCCYLCPMSFIHRDEYKAHMWEKHKVRC